MTDRPPSSPRGARLATPGWLDGRLVLGVLLVLVSVVVGARLLASADRTQSVWTTTRDLAPGSTLTEDDLRSSRVRLVDDAGSYLLATVDKPLGYVLARAVGAGELLPRASLARPGEPGLRVREVAVPVPAGHLPDDLAPGQQVDVFVTAGGAGDQASSTRLVLSAVPVALRPRASGLGAASTSSVVLSVPEADAGQLVQALQAGKIDLVRVPRSAQQPLRQGSAALPAPAAVGVR